MNVLIVGIGKIGGFVAYQILKSDKVLKLFILARNKEKLEGIVTDLKEAFPQKSIIACNLENINEKIDLTILSYSNLEWHNKIDVNDRIIEGNYNIKVLKDLINLTNTTIFKNKVLVISNPIDLLVRYITETTGNLNVFGFGVSLDSKRISYSYNEKYPSLNYINIKCIGEHGSSIVPILSSIDKTQLFKEEIYNELISHSFNRTDKIVKGYSIPVFGPWSELEKAIDILLNNRKEVYDFSVFLSQKVYGITNLAIGVSVQFGKQNYEISEYNISKYEKELFEISAKKLQINYQKIAK